MEWVTIDENPKYMINANGEIKFTRKNRMVKVTGNYVATYDGNKKMQLNIEKLLQKYFNKKIEDLPDELWAPVPGYEGLYKVSNMGRIVSLSRSTHNAVAKIVTCEKLMTSTINAGFYHVVTLTKNGEGQTFSLHRLVADLFVPNPENLPEVNHKKGDKNDNRATELEWCTKLYNMQHAFRLGLCKGRRKVRV